MTSVAPGVRVATWPLICCISHQATRKDAIWFGLSGRLLLKIASITLTYFQGAGVVETAFALTGREGVQTSLMRIDVLWQCRHQGHPCLARWSVCASCRATYGRFKGHGGMMTHVSYRIINRFRILAGYCIARPGGGACAARQVWLKPWP